jgi:hypothetical protein
MTKLRTPFSARKDSDFRRFRRKVWVMNSLSVFFYSRKLAFGVGAVLALVSSSFAGDPVPPTPPPVKPTFVTRVDPTTGLTQLFVERGPVEKLAGTFQTIKTGEVFYHWTDDATYARWMSAQGLNQSEFDALRKNFQGEAAGGGFYASRDPFNSSGFGVDCVEVHSPRDIRYFAGSQFLTAEELPLLFPDQATVLRTTAEAVSEILTQNFGVEVWEYNNVGNNFAWLNFMALDSVGRLASVNPTDVIASFAKGNKDLIAWASLDLKQALPKIDIVRSVEPDLYAYYLEGSRDPAMMDRLRTRLVNWMQITTDAAQSSGNSAYAFQLFPIYNGFQTDIAHASPDAPTLLNALRRDFHTDIEKTVLDLIAAKVGQPDNMFGGVSSIRMNGMFMGVSPAKVGLPVEGFSLSAIPNIVARGYVTPKVPNPFQVQFQASLNYLSIEDVVPAMAAGNGTPWTLYDEVGHAPFADRWQLALNNFQAESVRMGVAVQNLRGLVNGKWPVPMPVPDPAKAAIASKRGPKIQLAQLIHANQIISEDPKANLRGTVAIGEGEVVVGQKRYYRIDAWKKDRLLGHPLLVAEVIPDPANPGMFLARHEYPSAHTYKKFNSLLSARLQKQLADADAAGKLATGTDPEFKRLTQAIVAELLNGAIPSQYGSLFRAASVYPFGKNTDHVLQLFNFAQNTIPLPLRSWRESVYFTDSEFALLMENQSWKLYALNQVSFSQAILDNAVDPDFYGHSPLLDVYFDHTQLSRPGDAWRNQQNALLNSSTGEKARAESSVLPSWDPNDCIELFRAVTP